MAARFAIFKRPVRLTRSQRGHCTDRGQKGITKGITEASKTKKGLHQIVVQPISCQSLTKSRGDWLDFEPNSQLVQPFASVFIGDGDAYLWTAARLAQLTSHL